MKVLIYPNLNKINALSCTVDVCDYLKSNNVHVTIPKEYQEKLVDVSYATFGNLENLITDCDLVIAIGGDGTILKCSHIASKFDKAILGVNSGRLGFMSTMEHDEICKLSLLIDGKFSVEERMMIDIRLVSEGKEIFMGNALNDVVVSKGPNGKISDYHVMVDKEEVTSLRADGLIFSTPTGSTAYSLSAGGPIIDPDMECIEFTQICPHSLFARSMVFNSNKTIQLTYRAISNSEVFISIDGMEASHFHSTDELLISKSESVLKLIQLDGGNFYSSINSKLMKPLKD